jgi:diguanylate cyclase (GGDEF)-like protein
LDELATMPGGTTIRVLRYLSSPKVKLWILNVGLASAAIAIWLGPLRSMSRIPTSPHLAWWVLAPIFFVSNRTGMRWFLKQTSFNTGIAEVPLVLALFFSTPADLVIGLVVGQIAVEATRSARVAWRVGFAIAVHVFVVSLAILFFRTLLPNPSALDVKSWLVVFGAWAIFNLRTAFGVFAMRITSAKTPSYSYMVSVLSYSFGSASVGMLAAVLIAASPTSLIWLIPVVAAVVISTRVTGAELSQRQALEILAGAGNDLDTAIDFDATLHLIVARLRQVFRAELAQITLLPARPGSKAFRTTVSVDGPDEVVSPGIADLSVEFLDNHRHGLIVNASTEDNEARVILRRYNVDDALVAPVVIHNRACGYIVIGGHADEKDNKYRPTTLTVLQSLASQTAHLLQNKQLETAVADLSEREAELTYRAFHDPMTGLPNRALFMDRMKLATERQRRTGGTVTLALIGLDDLTLVNDRYGRAAGDYFLVAVAQTISGVLREGETASRFGGDRFAVVFEDPKGTSDDEVARRIAAVMREPRQYGSADVTVTVSVGTTIIGSDSGLSLGESLTEAETALVDAKSRGKNRCVSYETGVEVQGIAPKILVRKVNPRY